MFDPIAGSGFTVIVVVDVPVQPFAAVPVTVYVVVDAGVNGMPSLTPPLHEYDIAPVPLNVTLDPAHTADAGDVVEETTGDGFTVIVVVAVLVQPVDAVPVTV